MVDARTGWVGLWETVTCLWHEGTSHSFMAENELSSVCMCESECERGQCATQKAFGEENGAENHCVAEAFYWSRKINTKKRFYKTCNRSKHRCLISLLIHCPKQMCV